MTNGNPFYSSSLLSWSFCIVLGIIVPAGNENADRITNSLPAIVFLELVAQPMGLDANDVVGLRVELIRSSQHFRSDCVFLYFINSPTDESLDDELQEVTN